MSMPISSSCLNKLFVEFRYERVGPLDQQVDCSTMSWLQLPKLEIHDLDYHCTLVSPKGAGSWAVLFQVSGFIDWKLGFAKAGSVLTESHSVYFSIPVMYKDSMAFTALMAVTPWKIKAPYWLLRIAVAVRKLQEIDDVIKEIVKIAGNRCGTFDDLVEFLKKHEQYLNRLLKSIGTGSGGEGKLARQLRVLERTPGQAARGMTMLTA
jgi:hypothetical protein